MKTTVRFLRSALYFPLDVMPKIGIPYRVARWYLHQVVRMDAPFRRYLLGGRYEV